MLKSTIALAPEGLPILWATTIATLVFAVVGVFPVAIIFLLLTLFCLNFFRDPERVIPTEPGVVVSPADGKVIRIAPALDPVTGEEKNVVCVFMNVFNVHVNRSPLAGVVRKVVYIPGKFVNASFDKASTDNERCMVNMEDEEGRSWTFVQIAGLIARRIVCRAEEGDALRRGDRVGMIKFGSRVDIYMPEGYIATVSIGDKVLAGQSVIARKAS